MPRPSAGKSSALLEPRAPTARSPPRTTPACPRARPARPSRPRPQPPPRRLRPHPPGDPPPPWAPRQPSCPQRRRRARRHPRRCLRASSSRRRAPPPARRRAPRPVATEVRGTRPAEPAARPGGPAPLGLAIFAALTGLLAAFLLKNQCATHAWADNFQYRHLCYNDIQPLFHVRGVDHALVPYRDIQVEYPVLIGSFMYVVGRLLSLLVHLGVGWTSYNDPGYFQLSALLLAPFSLAVTLLLRPRVTAGRLMIWAVGTPTILYSFLNWD